MRNIVIIGGGVAGFTAALYIARANLEPLVLSGAKEGGQLMLTTEVENFPGFPDGIQGPELVGNTKKQAEKFGAEIKAVDVISVEKKDTYFEIKTEGETIQAIAVIIATGASARWLNIPTEKEFMGKGVHTCATCDGFFYKDKEIIVVGGGDSAMEEANFLTKFAKKVTLVHRRDEFRASKIMLDRAKNNPKIEFITSSAIEEIEGAGKVESVNLKNTQSGEITKMPIEGIFLGIGHVPNTKFLSDVDLDDHGFIKTTNTKTSMEGMFAAGDVQDPIYKQAITAAGTGCQSALEAEKYVEEWQEKNK